MKVRLPAFFGIEIIIVVLVGFLAMQVPPILNYVKHSNGFGEFLEKLQGVHYGMPKEPVRK